MYYNLVLMVPQGTHRELPREVPEGHRRGPRRVPEGRGARGVSGEDPGMVLKGSSEWSLEGCPREGVPREVPGGVAGEIPRAPGEVPREVPAGVLDSTNDYNVLQCTTMYFNVIQSTTMHYHVLQYTTLYYIVKNCATMYSNVLQYTTMYHNVR